MPITAVLSAFRTRSPPASRSLPAALALIVSSTVPTATLAPNEMPFDPATEPTALPMTAVSSAPREMSPAAVTLDSVTSASIVLVIVSTATLPPAAQSFAIWPLTARVPITPARCAATLTSPPA